MRKYRKGKCPVQRSTVAVCEDCCSIRTAVSSYALGGDKEEEIKTNFELLRGK
jgi:hypothetical protein